jgi:hypothetical protein
LEFQLWPSKVVEADTDDELSYRRLRRNLALIQDYASDLPTTMIIVAFCGFGLLILLAVAVAIIDSTQEKARRQLAAKRRQRWEEGQRAARNEQD